MPSYRTHAELMRAVMRLSHLRANELPDPDTTRPLWRDDDAGFLDQLRHGKIYQVLVAMVLQSFGIDVAVHDRGERRHRGERDLYTGETDLVANGHRMEVKSRGYSFMVSDEPPHLRGFRYDTIIVDTVAKFDGYREDGGRRLPIAYVLVSQLTGAVGVVSTRTAGNWVRISRHDRTRQYDEQFYAASILSVRPFYQLIAWLVAHQGTKHTRKR